jgi:hypothetical protein
MRWLSGSNSATRCHAVSGGAAVVQATAVQAASACCSAGWACGAWQVQCVLLFARTMSMQVQHRMAWGYSYGFISQPPVILSWQPPPFAGCLIKTLTDCYVHVLLLLMSQAGASATALTTATMAMLRTTRVGTPSQRASTRQR